MNFNRGTLHRVVTAANNFKPYRRVFGRLFAQRCCGFRAPDVAIRRDTLQPTLERQPRDDNKTITVHSRDVVHLARLQLDKKSRIHKEG